MEIMHWIINILLVGLLCVSIFAVIRLISVLNDVNKMLALASNEVTTAHKEVATTLERVDTVLTTAETLLREEVTPTLQVARTTLDNVEVTTRALAETTVLTRQVMQRVDGMVDAGKLAQVGGAVAQFALKKGAGAASGLLSSVASGMGGALMSLFHRKHPAESESPPVASKNLLDKPCEAKPGNGAGGQNAALVANKRRK